MVKSLEKGNEDKQKERLVFRGPKPRIQIEGVKKPAVIVRENGQNKSVRENESQGAWAAYGVGGENLKFLLFRWNYA